MVKLKIEWDNAFKLFNTALDAEYIVQLLFDESKPHV